MKKQKFHLGTIFSVYQSKFVSPEGLEGLQDLYEFMFNIKPMIHELGLKEFYKPAEQELLKQFSWLKLVDYSTINPKTATDWLRQQISVHGEYLEVEKTEIKINRKNPVENFVKNFTGNNVIVVSRD